ncbi:MAG: VCBS repeat-containing protein [Acidobacteriota bacterium]
MKRLLLSLSISILFCVESDTQSLTTFEKSNNGEALLLGIGEGRQALALGDLNGDNKPEIVAVNRQNNSITILANNGKGAFGLKGSYATGLVPQAVVLGDLNNDKKLDMVIANSGSNTISIFVGTGDGRFIKKTDYSTGAIPFSLAVADLNNDRTVDLMVANRYGNSVSIFLGTGEATFRLFTDYPTHPLPNYFSAADFNGDGKMDFAVASSFNHTITFYWGKGNGLFLRGVSLMKSKNQLGVFVADLNHDGKPDVIEANRQTGTLAISFGFQNDGSESESALAYPLSKGRVCATTGDLNYDGIMDIVVASSGDYPNYAGSITVLLGRNENKFLINNRFLSGYATHCVFLCDVDGDNILDIVIGNGAYDFGGGLSVIFGNKEGTFTRKDNYGIGGYLLWVSFEEDRNPITQTKDVWVEKQ